MLTVWYHILGLFPGKFAREDGEFWIPHSLALIEEMNLICVADRENERIQCFGAGLNEDGRSLPTGIFITKAEDIGRVYAIREKRLFIF